MTRLSLCTGLIFLTFVRLAQADLGPPNILIDEKQGTPGYYGAEMLQAALREKGTATRIITSVQEANDGLVVYRASCSADGPAAVQLRAGGRKIPKTAETFTIVTMNGKAGPQYMIAGSDERGLMYAELELADRIAFNQPIIDTTQHPAITTRAVSMYTMNRAYWESRFYDEAYWTRYFDTLAKNRFNSVVVIFGYENGGFLAPCYPYFFNTPGFDNVRMIAITPAEQAKNLAALNRMIDLAHERGLNFTVGIWDHIYRGGVQSGGVPGANDAAKKPTSGLVWGVTADNLSPYTKAALAQFIQAVPNLDGIQFRMHDESGLKKEEQEGFWRDVFQMIHKTAPQMRLDLRAKGLPDSVIQSAIDEGVNFRITTKYWMEQMGLPFHPTHVNPQDQLNRRHGYGDMLKYPQQYKIHWRLWNGGTARILLFGDPDYARRFCETTHLYDGDGFEVNEPLCTKMEGQTFDVKPFDLLNPKYRYYDYEFERYWHFFQVFGRIGYDPATPSEVFDREFETRFGKDAGPHIEAALHKASWILPRIVASSYPYSAFPMTVGWAEKQHFGDLPTFSKAQGSDVAQFESFDEEAERLITDGQTAKTRPQETSAWFTQSSRDVLDHVAEAEKQIGDHRSKEFDSTIVDLKILANLAAYHAQRIPAGINYRLYVRTKDPRALDQAIALERQSVEVWRRIVAAAGDVYADNLIMGAASHNLCGHWRDELAVMEKDLITLEHQRASLPPATQPAPQIDNSAAPAIAVTHTPITSAPVGKDLTITATIHSPTGIKSARVRYRSINQYLDYQSLPMQPTGTADEFRATISADQIPGKYDLMYYLEILDNTGGGIYPDLNKTTPYVVVHLTR